MRRPFNALSFHTSLVVALTFLVYGQLFAADDTSGNEVTTTPVVVTAQRFETSIETAPVNITTISAEDISRSNLSTLSDVLETVPGIYVSNLFGISGSKAKVDLGGFGGNNGQNTLILLNGRRLNDVDLQGANLAAIPIESIAQIEIVHGSSTVLYGDNAVSGVINIVTRNGFDGKQAKLKLQAGSFETQRLSGDLRTNKNNTALSLAFDALKSNGYRHNSAFDNFSLITEISKERADFNYGARVNASRDDFELPGALDEATFKDDPRTSTQPLEKGKERRLSIEGYFSGDTYAGELTLSKKHQEATVFGDTAADLSTLSITPRAKRQYGSHSLLAGIDLYHSKLETDAEFTNFFPPPATVENVSDTTRKSFALYITDTMAINETTSVNFGVRHQRVKLEIENDGNIGGKADDSSDDKLNAADISLTHKHRYGGQNYVRLARSFRSPVLDEMWDYFSGTINLLEAQTANHIEIGTRQTFANGLSLMANLFRMNITDEIAFNGTTNVNLDKTRHEGLNININHALNKTITVSAGLAARKATFRQGANKGNTIPQVPERKMTLSGNYQIDKSSQLGLNAIHTGERYFGDDYDNSGKKMPAYTQLNLSYSRAFEKWKLRMLIQNLNNVSTADSGYYAWWLTPPYTYYPLPDRALYLTFEGDM